MKTTIYQVDAFTTEKFSGNPAGIILDARGLSDSQMQAIARELNNTESAFLFPAEGPDHDLVVRFFTPTTEIPMCGHNTIALHFARAVEGLAKPGRQRQKTKAGIIPVDIVAQGDSFRVVMTHNAPTFDAPLTDNGELLTALGVAASDLSASPVQIVSTGNRKMMLGLKTRAALNAVKPDLAALKNMASKYNCTGYYLFTLETNDPAISAHGRMFAPQLGIDEDPVTGMAIGPFAAYLVENGLLPATESSLEFKVRQGEAMGRPGVAHVRVPLENGKPGRVEVGGEAVIVFRASVEI